jgi:hypothetical protein
MNQVINQWAIKHGVSIDALNELRIIFGTVSTEPDSMQHSDDGSEGAVQSLIRLEASRKGLRMWRNNVGAYSEEHPPTPGTRWGLANESKKMNTRVKSGDLIGIRPIIITESHVGALIGQFVSREVKPRGWQYSGTQREIAQLKWAELVAALGGDAAFANSTGTL